MRPLKPFTVILVLLGLLLAAPLAQARSDVGPKLDRGFGQNGRLNSVPGLSREWSRVPAKTAIAGDGDIYVAAERPAVLEPSGASGAAPVAGAVELRRYLPDGKPDPSFGNGGAIVVTPAPETQFVLTELLLDGQERPYLVGTSWAAQPTKFVGPYPSGPIYSADATVIRYTTAGAPDPGYGSGGYVLTNFALPATGAWVEPPAPKGPNVSAKAATIDSRGRVVLVAAEEEAVAGEVRSVFGRVDKLVARLTETGALDPTFAQGGILPLPSGISVGGLSAAKAGAVDLILPTSEAGKAEFQIEQLTAAGTADPSFGSGGARGYAGSMPIAWSREAGSGFFLEETAREAGARNSSTTVLKLDPAGAPVAGFGKRGRVTVKLPGPSYLRGVVADGHGGAYLLGTYFDREPGDTWKTARREFLAIHVGSDGKVDRGFGSGGRLRIRFGGDAGAFAGGLTPGGDLLVAGNADPASATGLSRVALAMLKR